MSIYYCKNCYAKETECVCLAKEINFACCICRETMTVRAMTHHLKTQKHLKNKEEKKNDPEINQLVNSMEWVKDQDDRKAKKVEDKKRNLPVESLSTDPNNESSVKRTKHANSQQQREKPRDSESSNDERTSPLLANSPSMQLTPILNQSPSLGNKSNDTFNASILQLLQHQQRLIESQTQLQKTQYQNLVMQLNKQQQIQNQLCSEIQQILKEAHIKPTYPVSNNNPSPQLKSLIPSVAPPGGRVIVNIEGSGLSANDCTIYFGTTPRKIHQSDTGSLFVITPSLDEKQVSVYASNDNDGRKSNSIKFEYMDTLKEYFTWLDGEFVIIHSDEDEIEDPHHFSVRNSPNNTVIHKGLYHMTRTMEWDNIMRSLQQHHQHQITSTLPAHPDATSTVLNSCNTNKEPAQHNNNNHQ